MAQNWKKLMGLTMLFISASSFGAEVTLYNQKGVVFKYKYEKISTSVDSDCPGVEFDEYKVSVKVENKNGKAIDAAPDVPGGIGSGKLVFNSFYCQSGTVKSDQIFYSMGAFMAHRSYTNQNPNSYFVGVTPYFLDANDQYVSSNYNVGNANMKILKGTQFPKPVEWNFPKWVFIDIPQKGGSVSSKQPAKKESDKADYTSLIVGKWCLSWSEDSEGRRKKNCDYRLEATADGRWRTIIDNKVEGALSGQWALADNIIYRISDVGVMKIEILELDRSKLITKIEAENWWVIETFSRTK